jgi:phenylpropionate dioxygenase-like ring-hydroxylating dioxygenase large terminal subunit
MLEPPRYQYGWFAPLSSAEVRSDRPTSFFFMGHTLVAFRDASGRAVVMDAICPHFGAHLGYGQIVNGCIRCPFHKLDFDREGRCVDAPPFYDKNKLQHLRAQTWASCERLNQLFIWHGADPEHPAWDMPLDALCWDDWTPPLTNKGLLVSGMHPLWVAENVVDLVHVRTVHGLDNLNLIDPPRPHDDGTYRVVFDVVWRLGSRSRHPFVRKLGSLVNSPFRLETQLLNPGILVTEATLTEKHGGLKIRTVVLVNPVGERDTQIRLLVSLRRQFRAAWARAGQWLLGHSPEELIAQLYLQLGMEDFRADAAIWKHRRHLIQPVQLKGDGPMVEFRRWSVRFWPESYAEER